MAAKRRKSKPPPASGPPTIHEAELASGPSGAVLKGAQIDLPSAIQRRRAGLDVVVCGDDVKANSRLAKQIEGAVGPYLQQVPHDEAGFHALSHVQQESRSPAGHCFYETPNLRRKARKQS